MISHMFSFESHGKAPSDLGFSRCIALTYFRTWIPVSFALLDSFPHIYSDAIASPNINSVSVRTSLSTDTSIASRIKHLRNVVGRSIGVDEREALSNSLASIAEAFEEGWDSGSDDDDDY